MFLWLWSLSILLAVLAIVTMAGMIVVRAVTGAQSKRRAEWRAEALERIFKMLAEDKTVQLPQRRQRGYARLLTGLAADLLALLRGMEREQLVDIFQTAGVPDILIGDLKRLSARRAQVAAENLRYFRSAESVAALRGALRHRTPEVRLAAALSLAEMEEAPRVEDLIAILHIGSEEQSRLVVDLLRRLQHREYDAILSIAGDRQRPPLLRLMALEALSEHHDPRLVATLSKIATDEDGDIAAQAIRFLGGLGDRSVEPLVKKALASSDWRMRVQAATAAGRLRLGGLVDDLTDLLDDDAWWVRHRVGEALELIGAGAAPGARVPARMDVPVAGDAEKSAASA